MTSKPAGNPFWRAHAQRKITLPYLAYESPHNREMMTPPLASHLNKEQADEALALFRKGLDTVDIASRMECTKAAASNGLAEARDRERAI